VAIKKISTSSLFNNTRYSKVMADTSQVQDVVDPPTITGVTAGGYLVTVAFTAKTTGSPATLYTVTASPGGATATGASSPITVNGLTPGTAYTFTVKGTNNRSIVGNESPASASATPDASFPIEYIVVAGGGGGHAAVGGNASGGGGGGGYRSSFATQSSGAGSALESTVTALAGNTYAISIGGGGGGGNFYDPYNNSGSGGGSTFGNITSVGGGRGGGARNAPDYDGSVGGSGGGAGGPQTALNFTRPGALGTAGQGSQGGSGGFFNGPGPDYYFQGGNGGGGNGSSGTGRAGGGAGMTGYGFGGGGMYGGGNGGGTSSGQAGTINTGGGGAVGRYTGAGGSGGSGIVILRYPNFVADITTIPGGLTYTKTTPSGYKLYTFTAGSGTITI
jgi:hypothetical protein